jgi:S-ribosylhomocysteine lyase
MDKISSFTVDHLRLLPGLYVSRIDAVGGQIVTTFDLRFTRPNFEPVLDVPAIHTIEHLGATLLRNDEQWGEQVLYFGPMGCRTGFYLLLAGEVDTALALPLVIRVMEGIVAFDGEVPGASPAECGNYLSHDLAMAKVAARSYLSVLDEIAAGAAEHTRYPAGDAGESLGFVIAMESELEQLKAVLPPLISVAAAGRTFWVGPGVFAIESGIGELAAASATEALVWFARSQGAPLTRVINAGVCGALVPGKFALGEPLVVEKVVHYEFDLSPIEALMPGQYPGEPSALLPLDVAGLLPDFQRATLASGDKFCSDPALAAQLVRDYGADICEMEAAGVTRTARLHSLPVTLIKTISDEAGADDQAATFWATTKPGGMTSLQLALDQLLTALR